MNNQGPFFNPFMAFQNMQNDQNNYEKLINKIDRLEKSIRVLENRILKLEKKDAKTYFQEEPTDMYMI